jgi:riboflavin synthase
MMNKKKQSTDNVMFTGLIQEIGEVLAIRPNGAGSRLKIRAKSVLEDAAIGDSIAVNGCCLTIVSLESGTWSADVVPETLQRTCLGNLKAGDPVNLESALRFNGRIGGHLVQGHIDGIGIIEAKKNLTDESSHVTITCPSTLLRYIVEKGSIAVDGVSLTVADVNQHSFAFAMIPHTSKATNLGWKQIGTPVNLEIDLMAKYLEKLITPWVAL